MITSRQSNQFYYDSMIYADFLGPSNMAYALPSILGTLSITATVSNG